ncbi:hypothetical protein ACIOJE_34895 [Kitasatospora sp. NPDC087861]|uniref:hypothetical protein n=1 Tax=Kitasatospora sp. NPDC087861 TaxID=3364070 RepID=UPI0038104C26
MSQVTQWAQEHAVMIGAAAALCVSIVAITIIGIRSKRKAKQRRKLSAGTIAAAIAFIICTSVSLHTSYGFAAAADGLNMATKFERVFSCAAFESLMAMMVFGARERLANPQNPSPGWYGTGVWVFAGLSAVPAWHEGDGFSASTMVRIIVGSIGSALAAHSALGLELRHRTGEESQAAGAQIAREIRERMMAYLGLAQRGQTAQEIARDRAMDQAVELADREARLTDKQREGRKGRVVARRLGRALEAAGTADPIRRDQFEGRLALRRHAAELRHADLNRPWKSAEEQAAEATEADRLRAELAEALALANQEAGKAAAAEAAADDARQQAAEARQYAVEAQQQGEQALALLTRQVEAFEALASNAEATAVAQISNAEAYRVPVELPRPRPEQDDQDDAAAAGDCLSGEEENESAAPGNAERPAAAGMDGNPRVQVRLPLDPEEPDPSAEDEDEDEDEDDVLDLARYGSKKAAIQALYHRDIAEDDKRTTNAIAEELRATLTRETGRTYDQAAAHRAISELRAEQSGQQAS